DAFKTLKRTIKTKEEIRKLLTEKKYSKESIAFAINTLEKQGYINDKKYANSYVHNAIITTNKGPKKTALALDKPRLNTLDYNETLEEYTSSLEKEKIEKLISKKIKSNHNKSAKVLKQKLGLDLINNGFHQDIIKEVLNSTNIEENSDIAKK